MSSDVMVHPARAAGPLSRGEYWLLDRLALASSALSGLVLFLFIGRGGWYFDDFLNMSLAQQSPLGRKYINLPLFGHPQPGNRLLNWLLIRLAPMDYPVAAGLVCLSIAFASWMVYRILRMSFRPSYWLVVLTAMVGTTGLWVPVAEWWAGGSEIAGCSVASVLTVHATLRCYRGPARIWWGALAGFWLVAGLCYYERALLGGLFAACFVLAVGCRRVRPAEILRVVRRAWPAYLALLIVALSYLYYYATHKFVHAQPGYSRSELLHYLWVSWSQPLIPGLFGGSIQTHRLIYESYAGPPAWWLIACQLGLLALVCYGVRRKGLAALRGWLIFLPIFLAAQYAIATARLHVHGPRLGLEFRYVADLLPLLVLTVGLTLLPARPELFASPDPAATGEATDPAQAAGAAPAEAADPVAATGSQPAAGRPRWSAGSVLLPAIALVALWAVFLTSAVPVSRRWLEGRSVRYVHNLRADIASQDRQGPWSLYTTYIPSDTSLPAYGRYSQTPNVAQLVSGHRVSADDLSKPMYLVDPNGHLRPARFKAYATVPAICSTGSERLVQSLSTPLPKGFWSVQLRYQVASRTTVRFAIDTGATVEEATGAFRGFTVSGSGRLTFQLRQASIAGFRLDAYQAGVCISDIQIGHPVRA